WEIIREEKERGALVVVACHDSEALESVADELFRMKNGEITDHIIK
ncbi:multidrug ABC transporter ATP-binding protein, partial [Mediterraneibacter glycyrrhizinilyticus]|nr:multidrug ABC transporter ATP-binding protein [Mediterraneibacter glycyrrhizinilyticus]